MDVSSIVQNIRFINLGAAIWAPLALMALDFATGFLNACLKGERSSGKMREGGGHKAAEVACIIAALIVDGSLQLDVKFVYIVSAYILIMEIVSIAENVKKILGPKTPKIIGHEIEQLHEELYDDSVLGLEHSATEDNEEQK